MRFHPSHLILVATLTAAPLLAQSPSQSSTAIQPMAADAHPTFAVATIKPHDPAVHVDGFHNDGRHISCSNESVAEIMSIAYGIHVKQITNGPTWFTTDRYDVDGVLDTEGVPKLPQIEEVFQKLLTDRFHLAFHRETRDISLYSLTIAKGGLKLKPAANPTAEPDAEIRNHHGTEREITLTNAPMSLFILNLQYFQDRPLVDRTGLTGIYDFKLRYTYDETKATDPDAPPGLFTAVQEQLGLKFQPNKAPVEVLVIDHIAPPSPN
jgi:uncharacterized protein (TIGR03435 family)